MKLFLCDLEEDRRDSAYDTAQVVAANTPSQAVLFYCADSVARDLLGSSIITTPIVVWELPALETRYAGTVPWSACKRMVIK